MNKFIEQELNKCKNLKMEQKSDTEFFIPKKQNVSDQLELNKCYEIELADYIIHPSENFTLASNWNKGIVPTSKNLKAVIVQLLGKMVKVDATGEKGETYIGLWLPMGGIKIRGEL